MMFELIVRPLIDAVGDATAAMAEEIAEDCAAALGEHFQHLDEACGAAADELLDATRRAFDAASSFASGDVQPRVEGAMAALLDVAIDLLGKAQDPVLETLEGVGSVIELAVALAPPVNWARDIVDTINSLLDAMNLGL